MIDSLMFKPSSTADSETLTLLVGDVLQRAPEWVRRDLSATDAAARNRAEDTLAGMIAAAIR